MSEEVKQKVIQEDKVMTVIEYFDYAVLTHKNNKVEEVHFRDATPKFEALVGDFKTVEDEVKAIRSIVRKDTISDVVMVIIYQMAMSKSGFERLQSVFKSLSEEKLILEVFKQNLYNSDGLTVRAMIPVVLEDRINIKNLTS